jgi:hypothetical protein
MKIKHLLFITVLYLLAGCEDKYQKGYDKGYADGVAVTEIKFNELMQQEKDKVKSLERQSNSYSNSYSTEVCGGNGVDVNGKHHSAGKTGCVRVHSDGRIEKY